MNDLSLTGCVTKLDRAVELVQQLKDAEHGYFGSRDEQPFRVAPIFDPSSNTITFVGQVLREPPARIGAIVGDVVHNLRSALDHLVWELTRAHSGDPEKFTNPRPAFPVCKDETRGRGLSRRDACAAWHPA